MNRRLTASDWQQVQRLPYLLPSATKGKRQSPTGTGKRVGKFI